VLIAPPYVHWPALFALIAAAVAPDHVILIVLPTQPGPLCVYPGLHVHATTARPAAEAHRCSYPVVYCDEFGGHDVYKFVLANTLIHASVVLVNNGLLELTGNASDGIKPCKPPQP